MPGWSRREPDVRRSSFSPDRNEFAWPRVSGVARRRGGGGSVARPTRVAGRTGRSKRAGLWGGGRTAGGRRGRGPAKLQQSRQQPEHAHSAHATVAFRAAHATTSSSPYMQTINGPVGRSALYETHRPSEEASAPEAHEM